MGNEMDNIIDSDNVELGTDIDAAGGCKGPNCPGPGKRPPHHQRPGKHLQPRDPQGQGQPNAESAPAGLIAPPPADVGTPTGE